MKHECLDYLLFCVTNYLVFMFNLSFSKYFFAENISPEEFNGSKRKILLLFLNTFTLIFFFLMFILNIIEKDFKHIFIDVTGILFFILFITLTLKNKFTRIILHSYVILIELIVMYLFFTGGVENTGIMYLIPLPLIPLFALGLLPGILIAVVNYLVVIIFIKFDAPWFPDYAPILVNKVSVIYFCVLLFSSVFVYIVSVLEKNFITSHTKLYKSREEYKELLSVREKFMSIYTHDLRGQIGNLHNLIVLLNDRYEIMNDERRKTMIHALKSTSNSNLAFLKSFLEWAVQQNQEEIFSPKNLNARELIFNAIEVYDQSLKEKSIHISTEVSNAMIVKADSNMFGAIIRNLISNSIKYSESNGMIIIRTKQTGTHFIVEVEDFGIGIPSSLLAKIKNGEEIYSEPGTSHEKGLGMGLTLCNEFINKHEGSLEIESERSQGTLVRVLFPQEQH